MTKKELDTKDKIIDATIKLIREEMDVNKITVRGIAREAGVTKSVINYHFDSKDSLIHLAVQSYIGTVISQGDEKLIKIDLKPEERLRIRFKQAAAFLASNPGVSRVSILSDLKNANEKDNSSQSLHSIFTQLKDIYGGQKDDVDLKIKAQQMLASLQEVFLRADVFNEQTGIDYYNEKERNSLVDIIIDNILK